MSHQEVLNKRAGEAAAKIHQADKAIEVSERIKDFDAMESSLLSQLEARRDFAAIYTGKFPQGRHTPVLAHDWCKSYGFAQRTVQRWLCYLDAEIFDKRISEISSRILRLMDAELAANYSSDSVEWYTPEIYLDGVREVLGTIDLDPASSAFANATVKATEIFTAEDDGLSKKWHGRVFMNPPYGIRGKESLAGLFCNKAISEFESGNVSEGIILVNSLHSQTWQAPLYKHVVCFVNKRIQFVSGDGEENKNPTFQNIFVYLGPNSAKFSHVFKRFGYVMEEVKYGTD